MYLQRDIMRPEKQKKCRRHTVINLSNVLLQSSVNSFGSIAMAGYTAANNIFGFLYVSINSVTQACMSFTSQNYGVKKIQAHGSGAHRLHHPFRRSHPRSGRQRLSAGAEDPAHLQHPGGRHCLRHGGPDLHPPFPISSAASWISSRGRSGAWVIPPCPWCSPSSTVGVRILWIYGLFPAHQTLAFLFVSYPASWIATIVMQVICFWFVRRRVYRMEAEIKLY